MSASTRGLSLTDVIAAAEAELQAVSVAGPTLIILKVPEHAITDDVWDQLRFTFDRATCGWNADVRMLILPKAIDVQAIRLSPSGTLTIAS